jgi:hypothetical protein
LPDEEIITRAGGFFLLEKGGGKTIRAGDS